MESPGTTQTNMVMAVAISPVALSMKPSDEENSSPLCVMRCIERGFLILPSYLRIQSVGLWSYSRFSCGRANLTMACPPSQAAGIADEPRQTRQVGYVPASATARQCNCWVFRVSLGPVRGPFQLNKPEQTSPAAG